MKQRRLIFCIYIIEVFFFKQQGIFPAESIDSDYA